MDEALRGTESGVVEQGRNFSGYPQVPKVSDQVDVMVTVAWSEPDTDADGRSEPVTVVVGRSVPVTVTGIETTTKDCGGTYCAPRPK